MKTLTPYIIIAIAFFGIGILITKYCSKERYLQSTINKLKEKLKTEQTARESKELEITALHKANDSLAAVKQQIKKQIVYRDREKDESIAKDSANALVWYRQALTENQELPDGTERLTYREIGIGSKLMAKVPRLELTIRIQDEIIFNKDKIIEDDGFIKKSNQESLRIKDLEIFEWQNLFEGTQSFWYDRLVVVAGVGGGYTGTAVYPFVGLTVGIKIWGSK
jgi:hypothetical protein